MSSEGPPPGFDLRKAAESGVTAMVTALLGRGVAVDSRSEDGVTPLIYAANGGFTATVEALLSHKAGIDLQEKAGQTALYCAAIEGHTAVVDVLVAAGAGMNIKAELGGTPLMAAADRGHTATVQSLVSAGVDMDTQSNDGQTALYYAAWKGHTAAVEVLVAAGADKNIVNNIGRTPLMTAAYNGHTATLQSLVAHGADMDIQDKDGGTALMLALDKKEFEAAEVLIKAGAGFNQQQKDGWTALFYAAREGHLPSVRLLLEGGADPTHKNKNGDTPFDIAKKNGHDSVMEELKKQTASQPVASQPVATEPVAREPVATEPVARQPVATEPVAREPVVIAFKDIELKETVGKGAFGAVFKGYWTSSDGGRQLVAIKQLSKVVEKEVKLLGSLCHPNIITLYGTSENKPYTYLVTDFAANGSLHDFISERPCSPDLKRALPWAKQVAEGMLYLHRRGIVHRDLKSSNVVLTSEWVAKICDLGAARELDHTTMMTSIGTVAWMPPEILMKKPVSKMCDVYSYGILLWELITHDQPFKELTSVFLIPHEVLNGKRPLIPESTDVAVRELIEKCWQTKPEDRPVFESVLYSLEECEMGKMEYGELEFSERVGGGAFGVVFRGFWNTKKAGKIVVAIKNLMDKEDEKEVKVLSSLRHPNFTRYYGCVTSQLHLSIVTEFAEKGSIAGYISARKGKPERARALKWAREIAEAMRYLHERGFVHRDLKSENVVLTSDWTAKICDMGTAKKLKATVKQTFTGTIAWIAPEILKEEPASQKCDVYSYAIVLWELATFQVPFEGVAELMIPDRVFRGERPAIPSGCDQSLSGLIQRCWADHYKERPSFDEVLKTLKSVT